MSGRQIDFSTALLRAADVGALGPDGNSTRARPAGARPALFYDGDDTSMRLVRARARCINPTLNTYAVERVTRRSMLCVASFIFQLGGRELEHFWRRNKQAWSYSVGPLDAITLAGWRSRARRRVSCGLKVEVDPSAPHCGRKRP